MTFFPRPIRHLWQQAPLPRLLALLLMLVLASLSEGVGMLLLVPILQALQPGQGLAYGGWRGAPLALESLLALFLLVVALRNALLYWRDMLGAKLQFHLVDTLRQRCFGALLHSEWRALAGARKADHANLLVTDVNRVGAGLQSGLGMIAALLTMLAYALAALSLAWDMTLVALLSGAAVFGILAAQRRRALALGQELGRANRALQAKVEESMAGLKLAKILRSEARHLDLFRRVSSALREQQLHFVASSGAARALFQVGGALLLVAYLYAGLRWRHTPIPELLTMVLIFARMIPLFSNMQQHYHHWLHAFPALAEIDRLLDTCMQAAEPAALAGSDPWPIREAVCVREMSLCYPERARAALDKVSLTFPARTTTAIMGASGAGKSSLADVLIGLLEPDHGALLVDGIPVRGELRLRWRHSVAYVPQENFLFHDTIRNNLLWGSPHATDADLRAALARAAADFVASLPLGLDTMVGDAGVRLSGGERQRLALARALLRRPSLLILDEATSALDHGNEARIAKAIDSLHGDLTIIVIGHRPFTPWHADQVLILKDGRVERQEPIDQTEEAIDDLAH